MDEQHIDWRDIAQGRTIATPGMKYVDQPYVVTTPDGGWLCMLTVGTLGETIKGSRNYTAVTLSYDKGKTWTPFASCNAQSYAVPLVTPYGRVYALKPQGFSYSEDCGKTWSEWQPVPIFPEGWNAWGVGMPLVTQGTVWLPWARIGLARPPRRTQVYLYRSDNLLEERNPANSRWELLPKSGDGIRGPHWDQPEHRAEEPHVVALSDGTLYCVFRTDQGHIGYAVSRDAGDAWSDAKPLTYVPNGTRQIKHPLACPSLWKCENGRYLLFFHNHGGKTYKERNPAWICGGTEQDGEVAWSEPEILLYSDDLRYHSGRISYPGFLEQDGRYWVFETQKTLTRVHEIPASLFDGTWGLKSDETKAGLILSLSNEDGVKRSVTMPELPRFLAPWSDEEQRQGFAIELEVRFDSLDAGQTVLDNRTSSGQGFCLETTDSGLQIVLNDGRTENRWMCDPGMMKEGHLHHVVVNVDGGPKVISFVIDGTLCDGGTSRQYGWGRFNPNLQDVNGAETLRVAPNLQGMVTALRIYNRYLCTYEAVALRSKRARSCCEPKAC
jgi:hypothetical protein